jgi:acyl carrier protein
VKETNGLKTAPDADAPADPVISAERAESAVLDAFRHVLGLAEVDPDVPFAALGGDSMRAVRVLSQLWRALGVELPVHSLGNATTAAEFVRTVREHGAGAAA